MPADICFRVRQIPLHLTLENLIQAIEECFSEDGSVSVRVDRSRTTLTTCCYKSKIAQTCILHFDSKPPRVLESLGTNVTYVLDISPDSEILIDKDFFGLTQLYTPSMDIKLDIIALSGLNGHAYGSWTNKGVSNSRGRRKMWLRHFFQQDRRECRTMIYGYNSRLSEPGIHTLSDYSGTLLEEIDKVRKGNEDRPIALIGHSFGGIIIADAIVNDKENPRRRGCLFKMTKAMVFFATPHRGILFDDILEMVGEGSPRLDLVHSIGTGQENNLQSFIRYVKEEHFRVVSIQETIQTRKLEQNPSTNEWARTGPYYTPLERESSILKLPRYFEDILSSEGDHSTLVKFSHSQESTYTTLLERFEKLLDDVTQACSRDQSEINTRLRVAVSERDYSLVSILLTLGKANPDAEEHECNSEIIKLIPLVRFTKDPRILKLVSLHNLNNLDMSHFGYTSFIHSGGEHDGSLQAGREHGAEDKEVSHSTGGCGEVGQSQVKNASKVSRHDVLAWLSSLEPENDDERIYNKRHGDTGRWFLESTEVRKWLEKGEISLLWCYGSPGVGKSVLTSTLLESVRTKYKNDKDVGIAYLYFSFQATSSQEPADVLRIWIKQLCRRLDDLPESLLDLHKACTNDDIKPRFSELQCLTQEVINKLKKVFIVIDALDECSKENRKALVNHLVQISKHSSCEIKFFIASRREVDIERILLSASFSTFPVEVTKVDADIATYIIHELRSREHHLFELGDALKEAIQTRLLAQSNGMFLWVRCQLDYIYEQPSEKDVAQALDSLPATIVDTYDRILKKINNQPRPMRELANRVLCWVLAAKRPLSAPELSTAVAVEPTALQAGPGLFEGTYQDGTVLASCCGFITNECGTVRPIHFTVKEFLKERHEAIYEGSAVNTFVAKSLLKYLLVSDFEGEGGRPIIPIGPRFLNLLEYSCVYLNLHLGDLDPLPLCVLSFVKELLGKKKGMTRRVILEVFKLQGKNDLISLLIHKLRYQHYTSSRTTRILRLLPTVSSSTEAAPLLLLSSLDLLPLYVRLYKKPHKIQLEQLLHQVIRNGSVPAVKELLQRGCDINCQDADGNTPLLTALGNGFEEVTVFLIAGGADIHRFNRYGTTALFNACKYGLINIVKALIINGANANDPKNMEIAIQYRYTGIVKALLEGGANANFRGELYRRTALQLAASYGATEIVKVLIGAGADVNAQGGKLDTPICSAARYGSAGVVKTPVTDRAAHFNTRGDLGHFTTLQLAAFSGAVEVVNVLVQAGAIPGSPLSSTCGTALQEAVRYGDGAGVVKDLLEAGADIQFQVGLHAVVVRGAAFKGWAEVAGSLKEAWTYEELMWSINGAVAIKQNSTVIAKAIIAGAKVNIKYYEYYEDQGKVYERKRVRDTHISAYWHLDPSMYRTVESSTKIIETLLEAGAGLGVPDKEYSNALHEAVRRNSIVIVKAIIEAAADPNTKYRPFYTAALRNAVEQDRPIEIIEALLEAGADSGPAFTAAFKRNSIVIVKAIIAAGADHNTKYRPLYTAALRKAVEQDRSMGIMEVLLEAGADSGPAFTAAFKHNSIVIVKALIAAVADPNTNYHRLYTAALLKAVEQDRPMEIIEALLGAGTDSGSAFAAAFKHNSTVIVKAIVAARADHNTKYRPLYTAALREAVEQERPIEIVEALLEAVGSLSIHDCNYGIVLFEAVRRNSVMVIKAMIQAGADINIEFYGYGTALREAIIKDRSAEVVRVLLEAGADVNIHGGNQGSTLQAAIILGRSIEIIKALLDAGADVHFWGGSYSTVLHAAAHKGSAKVVKVLLEAGADANIQGGKHGTALQAAIVLGRSIDIINVFLEAGAAVSIQGGKHGTALQAAVVLGRSIEIIKALLKAGADVNIQSGGFRTVLHSAIVQGRSIEVVKVLLEAGATVDVQGDLYHGTTLQLAASNGAIETVKVLIEAGANVNVQGGRYGTALGAAARCGSADVVKVLLKAGAHVNVVGDLAHGSALQFAASNGATEIVKVLIGAGANVNSQGGMYGAPLRAAARCGSAEVVKALITAGAHVNTQHDFCHGTALQFAVSNGAVNVVKVLIEAGANVNIQGGPYGNTLLAMANASYQREREEMFEILSQAAAIDGNELY